MTDTYEQLHAQAHRWLDERDAARAEIDRLRVLLRQGTDLMRLGRRVEALERDEWVKRVESDTA